jgi:hypothetical protein
MELDSSDKRSVSEFAARLTAPIIEDSAGKSDLWRMRRSRNCSVACLSAPAAAGAAAGSGLR